MPQQSNLPTTAASACPAPTPLALAAGGCSAGVPHGLPSPICSGTMGPQLLSTVLSKQLHTPVTVAGVAGGWLSGLELRGIEVAESPAPQAPLLLRLERLSLNLAAVWLFASSDPIALRLEDHRQPAASPRRTVEHGSPAGSPHHTDLTCRPKPSKPLRCPIAALTSH